MMDQGLLFPLEPGSQAQEPRLARQYFNEEGTHKLMRKVFVLPFLPMKHMQTALKALNESTDMLQLINPMDYVLR